ncbi:MAG: threonylcarbamoyl-AMP synthase [Victivallales bacterium]|nr:threonylcarbamoyl-AMP synthase [Victivallales bacterium]
MMLRLDINDASALEKVARILQEGGVVALPTETVYGLVTLWDNKAGRARIYALKRRPANKLLQMLASSVEMAEQAGIVCNFRVLAVTERFCPGPITIVAPDINGGSIGFRIPNNDFILRLLLRLGKPLAATSANLSGKPAALNAKDAVCDLDGEPDAVLDGGEISVTGGQASTVLSLLGEKPVILREGPVLLEEIEAALKV